MPTLCTKIRNTDFVICQLVFVALALVLLWPVVRHPGWWIWAPGAGHSDLAVTHWPNAHFTRRSLWEDGQFPLWRPTIMSGVPFAANPLAGLYYPLNWFLLFLPWLPLEVGFNLSALVHLWLAGAAMYTLLRRGFGTGVWGALVAAVIYEASPKLLAHLGAGHVGWVQAWGWLPVAMLCLVRMCECVNVQIYESVDLRGCGRWAVGAGVVLAIQFLADIRMAAYTLVAMTSLMLVFAIHHSPFIIRHSPFAICPFLIFLGLTACQWLPMVALLPETTRASMTLHDAAVWSLPWQYLAGLLLANHGGFHEWMTYVGVSTLVLAGVGVLWRERRERWLVGWLAGLAVGAAWFSLGENGGLFLVLWRVVPGLGLLRVPPRAWILVVFSMAVLAGFGVEEVQRRRSKVIGRFRRWKRASWLAIGAFPPLLVAGYWLWVGVPPLNLVMFGVLMPLMVTVCNSQLVARDLRLWGGVIVLVVVVDLLVVDATLVEARSPKEVFADGRAAAEWLAGQRLLTQRDRFRIYSPSYSIPQHVAELYELELADGVDPLQLRVYADYLTRAAGLKPQGYGVTLPFFPEGDDVRTALKDMVPDAEMLGLLGVKYAATAFPIAGREWQLAGQLEEVYVYENRQAEPLPETSGVGGIVLVDGTTLFKYRPGPAYVGWVVSGMTVFVVLLGCWIGESRRRHTGG